MSVPPSPTPSPRATSGGRRRWATPWPRMRSAPWPNQNIVVQTIEQRERRGGSGWPRDSMLRSTICRSCSITNLELHIVNDQPEPQVLPGVQSMKQNQPSYLVKLTLQGRTYQQGRTENSVQGRTNQQGRTENLAQSRTHQ